MLSARYRVDSMKMGGMKGCSRKAANLDPQQVRYIGKITLLLQGHMGQVTELENRISSMVIYAHKEKGMFYGMIFYKYKMVKKRYQ